MKNTTNAVLYLIAIARSGGWPRLSELLEYPFRPGLGGEA
jgi:hypothetical protein